MKLAYGNYGMPQTPVATMLRTVAEIGYDGLELCVAPGYPTAPDQLSRSARHELRTLLAGEQLEIASMMLAKIPVLTGDPSQHQQNLDYLRRVLELRNELGCAVEISSTLGGKSAEWEKDRQRMAAVVAEWADVAQAAGAIFAFEPHVGGLVNSPQRARWLIERLNHPALRLNFDYSHFELVDIPLEQAVEQLIPWAAGVHIKDVSGREPDFRFLLPGEGHLDYAHYLSLLRQAGYDGYITIEISGQIFNAPGYDAVQAARFSYETAAGAFTRAGLARDRHA